MTLRVAGIEASYGELKVLHGVSLTAQEKDIVAIIGPNGSGKSTTIKSIFGIKVPDRGSVLYKGEELVGKSPEEIVRRGMAYVPQGRMVFQSMTVDENLRMGGFTLENVDDRLETVYGFFPDLVQKKNQQATFLSGGQQQMLSIGRALMIEPSLLLLDEPSLGLAPNVMVAIFRKIKEINEEGTTIVLIEQNAHMALEICTKAYVLEQGKIALEGGPELAHKKKVKDLYLGH